jgi:ribosomal protein S6
VKKYEGLFILNIAGKEDGVKDIIDRISADIAAAGGKIETVQKMDKKSFSRVADKKHGSGFYVNFIFELAPAAVTDLRNKFAMNADIFRVLFSIAAPVAPAAPVAVAK